MKTCEGAPQDPMPHSPQDKDEEIVDTSSAESPRAQQFFMKESATSAISTTNTYSPPPQQYSTQKSAVSKHTNSILSEDAAKTPLCICPTCDKVLASMKSLFGHFGRAHRAAISQDQVKYACPFCDTDTPDFQIFETNAELAAHIDVSHPECTLLTSLTYTSSNASAAAAAAANRARKTPIQKPASPPPPPASDRRRSVRQKVVPELPASSHSNADGKLPKQQFKHPLCQCPSCPRILPPQGIFGHFGRVHSGQLSGHSTKFEWDNVVYACPFCPEELRNDGSQMYQTFELIEDHVRSHHANCHLLRPKAPVSSSERSKRTSLPEPVAVCSDVNEPTRKSRRSRRPAGSEGQVDIDIDIDDANSSTVATRKSRSRRPVDSGGMTSGEGNGKRQVAAKQHKVADESDVAKPLYNCPDCDKKNLTKHGLHAHYGMVHGGKVDMDRVTAVTKRKKKVNAPRLGPWTVEEHEAFLEGHSRLGNRWKQISVEYVPTRDAKQIGSHALNYFTTRGEWKQVASSRPELADGGNQQGQRSDASGASSLNHRRSNRVSSNKHLRHSWIGNTISTDPMEVDDSKEEEEDGVGGGVDDKEGKNKEETAEATTSEGDDGNSSHCIICFEGGNILCCSQCPRAYHPKCLARDGHGNINVDLLPNDWHCNRCRRDSEIVVELGEEISQKYAFGSKKIRSAYAEFKDCPDYNKCCALLSNILDIINKLLGYDYGYIFSEPVDVEDVPDYVEVIHTPIDYGTVSERIEGGNYVDLIASDDVSRDDENSTMEEILLHVLCDIERVHFNCQLYNKEGSSIHRIGGIHTNKWKAYFFQYILDILPDNVDRDLTLFRHQCKLELEKGSHSKRVDKVEKSTEESSGTPLKSPCALSQSPPPTVNHKKRKAPESPLEKNVEKERKEEDKEESKEEDKDEEEDEEEQQQKPKPKKAKQEGNISAHSPALLFTEEQIKSLENVFFSSVTKLREEFDDLDACSALTSLLAFNTIAAKDGKTDNASAAGGHVLSSVKSEPGMDELHHKSSKNDSCYPTTSLQLGPELHDSGHTTVNPPPALPTAATCSTPASGALDMVGTDNISTVIQNPNGNNTDGVPNTHGASREGEKGSVFQRQWYERLNELKEYKLKNGTAVVSATSNDKLYHWRLRQRKRYPNELFTFQTVIAAQSHHTMYHLTLFRRYHLTLFRMSHLKKEFRVWDSVGGEDENDKQWLLAVPEMKGVFALSEEGISMDNAPTPYTIKEKDVESDEKTADAIHKKHKEQLYCLPSQMELLPLQHASRHMNSLFWDECLEELRFFQGEHQHTLVPRDFPHNSHLPLWVEIQRTRYLLQSMGLFSGLMGWQMLVLEELDVCNLSSLPYVDRNLAITASDSSAVKTLQKGNGHKTGGMTKTKEGSTSPEKKTWSTLVSDFKQWFQKLSPEDKPKASELLPRANWSLYSWCWRQCNASSAVLCMTPNVNGISVSVKKLSTLASAQFFHAFPYNKRNGLVREDDYEASEAFDSTFQILEDFSIKYGSTRIPEWYECDPAFLMWVSALERGLSDFVKGEPSVLSVQQIERSILIGFFNDRDALPNLSKGDVVWLKMLLQLKRHRALFGVDVSKDFPHLHKWVEEHKLLFRLSRIGKTDMLKASRLKMLMEAGVDFFTGDCLPYTDNLSQRELKELELLTSSPVECFPVKDNATSSETTCGWNFGYDNYWMNQDCQAKFEQLKAMTGSSLILATDDEDVYLWFVEKRGKILLSKLNNHESQITGSNGQCSVSILSHITAQGQGDNTGSDGDVIEASKSMFLWLHYCERLMMFKARKGHCKLPKDYPDVPLRQWLTRQQELIHLYSTNQPKELLPVQIKILHSLGLHGRKRISTPPKPSSRMLRRKTPSRKDKKSRENQ